MKKACLTPLILLVFILPLRAQSIFNQPDNQLVKKYQNDTTHFTAYTNAPLLININPAKHIAKIEINSPYSTSNIYQDTTYRDGRPHVNLHIGPYYIAYKNLYRYPAPANKLPDSLVLSKFDFLKSFTVMNGPSAVSWYISAQMKNGKVFTVGDTTTLKTFLGEIKNPYDAYLWLKAQFTLDQGQEIPINTSLYYKYKKVKGGFLLYYRATIGTYPVTSEDKIYFIGKNFRIALISERNLVKTKIYYKT